MIAKIDAAFNLLSSRLCAPLILAVALHSAACLACVLTRRRGLAFRLGRTPFEGDGGADRDRTDDPLLAKQMLSQLSYSPGST